MSESAPSGSENENAEQAPGTFHRYRIAPRQLLLDPTDQLTPEQLQVYSDFTDSFSKPNFKLLPGTTFPLELSALAKAAPCLQGLQLDGTEDRVRRFIR